MGGHECTRRDFVASLAALGASPARTRVSSFPDERQRYTDSATELSVLRLTSPEHSSLLPPACQRAVSRRGTFLLFSSDRTGSPQPMQMLLSTGESRQLTEARSLDPSSLALSQDDRSAYFFDGPALRQIALNAQRGAEVYRVPEGWSRARGFSLSRDGSKAYLAESKNGRWRLREVPLGSRAGEPVTVSEAEAPLLDPLPRPGHGEVLYRDGEGLLGIAGAHGNQRLPLAPGRHGSAFWSAGGESLLYLDLPGGGELNAIREWVAESGSDRLIAPTSQYASFAPNANGSVFVGSSASKPSPYIVLMLRVTHRELALCEHRSSDPAAVSPIFSPDSQRVLFQTDRDGKPAIYMLDVQRLVERTDF